MQPDPTVAPTNQSSFAGLLAALTASKTDSGLPPVRKSASAWDDDGLADDVATISYENALRARARYRAAEPHHDRTDRSLTSPDPDRAPTDSYELAPLEDMPVPQPGHASAAAQPASVPQPAAQSASAPRVPAELQRNLKSASVTIRMSPEEAAQLHRRAAEAGLTVSAYLRSCTFEAENLRALVKDTMAQLRASTAAGKEPATVRSGPGWSARLFMPWRARRRMARV